MKWIGIGFGISCAVVFVFFAFVFIRMIFAPQFAELTVLTDKTLLILRPGVHVSEVPHQLPPLEWQHSHTAGDVPAAEIELLTSEGKLEKAGGIFDSDAGRGVQALAQSPGVDSKVFFDRKIFARNDDELGPLVADFSDGPFSGFNYIGGVNEDWFLIAANPIERPYGKNQLWQVSHKDSRHILLVKNLYFTHHRPPKTFAPEGFDGVLVAIYADDVSYGSGGFSSAPRYSILRAYTTSFPDGVDLVRFSLRAGTIVGVEWREEALVVTTDPSRPTSVDRRLPPRIWSVALAEGVLANHSIVSGGG
ncbi:hypothetical protein [uncultured Microbulbifer sp.]|uniref:hypothetical protein n=1 Tax=uncultured Microbulbifer sp. TaxID=348147 RepID=UPI0026112E49|nr:hypothetical protein [uncultured Microbulbifer sp.]